MKISDKKIASIWVVAGLAILALIVLSPLLSIGYTTNDDAVLSVNYTAHYTTMEVAKIIAQVQGRVTFFWGYPILRFPYIFDNWYWFNSIRLGSFLLLIGAMYYSACRLFGSKSIGYASILFFLSFMQNGWDHNGITSYPFAFIFIAASLLTSFAIYADAVRYKSINRALIAAVLYGTALANESAVLFFPLYLYIHWTFRPKNAPRRYGWQEFTLILPLFSILFLYLLAYVLWRWFHPTGYNGNQIGSLNIAQALKVLVTYTIFSFPIASLEFISHPQNLTKFFTENLGAVGYLALIKAIISGSVFYLLLSGTERQTKLKNRSVIPLVITYAFAPNLLIALTEKYQGWVSQGSKSYLYTLYSLLIFSIAAGVILVQYGRSYNHTRKGRFLLLAIAIIFAACAFAVDMNNRYYFLEQAMLERKGQIVNKLLSNKFFTSIPENSKIISPSLINNHKGIAIANAAYWDPYVYKKTGKQVHFYEKNECGQNDQCYYLNFSQNDGVEAGGFLTFSPIQSSSSFKNNTIILVAQYLSGNYGAFLSNNKNSKNINVSINGNPAQQGIEGIAFFPLEQTGEKYGVPSVYEIQSDSPLNPDKFFLLRSEDAKKFSRASVTLGDGFFAWEQPQGLPPFSWSGAKSSVNILNSTSHPLYVKVNFNVKGLNDLVLHVNGKDEYKVSSVGFVPISVFLWASPGLNSIKLESDRPGAQPGNGDPRLLSFSLSKVYVQIENVE